MRDVGRRVAELREERGLTQERFAEEVLKRSKGHVQRIEHGELNLTLRSLLHLADRLGVIVADLFVAPRSREIRRGRPVRPKT
ncbi:MAG: helix-turn-helix domain-containing protein [Polyangiaceae bacterium]